MIQLHGKQFANADAVLQYRTAFTRWRFKDGQTGRIHWYPVPSIFGIFTPNNGTQFTVQDSEVTPQGRGG